MDIDKCLVGIDVWANNQWGLPATMSMFVESAFSSHIKK